MNLEKVNLDDYLLENVMDRFFTELGDEMNEKQNEETIKISKKQEATV